jgi:hypothetical protein
VATDIRFSYGALWSFGLIERRSLNGSARNAATIEIDLGGLDHIQIHLKHLVG